VPQSIDKLTAAMAAGDSVAVETFYREYFNWLYAQARRATGRDESFCLDVVQDAVLRIVRTVRPVASEVRFYAWLRLVVRTTALDLLRSESRRRTCESAVVVGNFQNTESSEDRSRWLEEQIARFDPMIIQAIDLKYRQGWTLARIASMLGLSIGTVDGRIRRAITDLQNRAKEEFDD
jgi:RNA polymerase sigma factor (sigma-70 family)